MAASQDRKAPHKGPIRSINHGGVNGGSRIFAGTLVSRDSGGYIIPSTSSTAPPCGVALQEANNTAGSDGDISCEYGKGVFGLINHGSTPVTIANVEEVCFVSDNQTVGTSAVGNVIAGVLIEIDPDDGLAYVLVGDAFVQNEAQT